MEIAESGRLRSSEGGAAEANGDHLTTAGQLVADRRKAMRADAERWSGDGGGVARAMLRGGGSIEIAGAREMSSSEQ